MHAKMARTHSTNAFTGANNTNYRTTGGTLGDQKAKKSRYRFRRTEGNAKKYDPENPFTFWLQGTDKCNEDFQQEKETKRAHIKSAQSDNRRVPHYDRLSKKPGTETREGFFRKLRNEIGDVRYEASRGENIINNLQMFEQRLEDKTIDIDFNDLVYKAKRIPVKKYIEYKREIRLSKLKQVDIEANINDMKNLIVKADEELEENIGTEKKSMEEIAQAVKYSREQLEKAKKKKLDTNSELNNVVRNHNEIKTRIAHLDNEIRELRSKNLMMEKNREFLLFISGLDEDPKWNPTDGRRMIDCEMVFVDEFKDVRLPDLDVDDDVLTDMFSRVMITEAGTVGKVSGEHRDFSKLSELEKRNGLLRELKSPEEFMDKLRAIESGNLDIIQYSQSTVEEINKLEKKISQ